MAAPALAAAGSMVGGAAGGGGGGFDPNAGPIGAGIMVLGNATDKNAQALRQYVRQQRTRLKKGATALGLTEAEKNNQIGGAVQANQAANAGVADNLSRLAASGAISSATLEATKRQQQAQNGEIAARAAAGANAQSAQIAIQRENSIVGLLSAERARKAENLASLMKLGMGVGKVSIPAGKSLDQEAILRAQQSADANDSLPTTPVANVTAPTPVSSTANQ